MPITLYGFNVSPPYRAVLLTAKAIGLEVQEKNVDPLKGENKTEEFLKMNPTHTVPTLNDNGFCIWESRAIMAYLLQQYAKTDKLYPKEPKKRAVVDNMLFFDADCLYSSLLQYVVPIVFGGQEANPVARGQAAERLGFLNTILASRKFAAGDQLTIADITLSVSAITADAAHFNLEDFPNIVQWLARVKAEMPFYDQVNKEGAEIFKTMIRAKVQQ